jgi:membrane associated rhomboid family serine protease
MELYGVLEKITYMSNEKEGRASGAISGILGAFLIFNPKARITLLPDPILLYFMARYFHRIVIRIPAWVFLPIWFLIQLSMGMEPQRSGVAFWAHAGGFLTGAIMALAVYKYLPKERFHAARKRHYD